MYEFHLVRIPVHCFGFRVKLPAIPGSGFLKKLVLLVPRLVLVGELGTELEGLMGWWECH